MTIHATPARVIPDDVRDRVEATLRDAASSRRRQLDELPPIEGDLVASAHRDSVERILAEICTAQERLLGGSYGTCHRCGGAIPLERLELRPWSAFCVTCAAR